MNNSYIILTAAKNEAKFIGKTIESVIAQTVLPIKWIIVNDASTDNTAEIIENYKKHYPFIELINIDGRSERNFGSKAKAIMFAYERIKYLDFKYIGNLDADVFFESTYYEKMINILNNNDRLGLVGGKRFDYYRGGYRKLKSADNSVGGPFQFFRKNCFESISGYLPLKYGGIDSFAEIRARELGWIVRSYEEFVVYHQRCTGEARGSIFKRCIIDGKKSYHLGYHPIFFSLKFLNNLFKMPFVCCYLLNLFGFFSSFIRNEKLTIPQSSKTFLRNEQMQRILSFNNIIRIWSKKSS